MIAWFLSNASIDTRVNELKERFDVEDEGSIDDYFGVQAIRREDQIELTQPHR